jgi:hypothetical protein
MRNWTNKEEAFMIENYKKFSVSEIAKQLNRPYLSVRNRAFKLGLSRDRNWLQSEIKFITQNFNKMTYKEMTIILNQRKGANRTESAVSMQLQRLKLKKNGLRFDF